jgi:hypothetical protein
MDMVSIVSVDGAQPRAMADRDQATVTFVPCRASKKLHARLLTCLETINFAEHAPINEHHDQLSSKEKGSSVGHDALWIESDQIAVVTDQRAVLSARVFLDFLALDWVVGLCP